MLGFSFGEIMVISLVALVAVGPQKLPGMLKTMGQWVRKLRQMTMDVRQQTGIDEMLRAEGIQLSELRSLMRGYHAPVSHSPAPVASPTPAPAPAPRYDDPYEDVEPDPTREYPLEGADSFGALPDDLLEPSAPSIAAAAPGTSPAAQVTEAPAPPSGDSEPADVAGLAAPSAPEEPVVVAPVVVAPVTPAAERHEPELAVAAEGVAPAPPRSAPPPPPSRSAVPRPSSGPPPPPRRASGPPRPEPAPAAPPAPGAAPASTPHGSGNANGNG